MIQFDGRKEAGRLLAQKLKKFQMERPVILALPRGGLPVGFEIAKELNTDLDIILVRKISVPGQEELAAGALVDGIEPELILNEAIVKLYEIPRQYLEDRKNQQLKEIKRRRQLYLSGRKKPEIKGKTVIIADDGIATGATMRAAVQALKRQKPAHIVIAVPVAPADVLRELEKEADEIICLDTPYPFYAVGAFYKNFTQLTDEDVIAILRAAPSNIRKGNNSPERQEEDPR